MTTRSSLETVRALLARAVDNAATEEERRTSAVAAARLIVRDDLLVKAVEEARAQPEAPRSTRQRASWTNCSACGRHAYWQELHRNRGKCAACASPKPPPTPRQPRGGEYVKSAGSDGFTRIEDFGGPGFKGVDHFDDFKPEPTICKRCGQKWQKVVVGRRVRYGCDNPLCSARVR